MRPYCARTRQRCDTSCPGRSAARSAKRAGVRCRTETVPSSACRTIPDQRCSIPRSLSSGGASRRPRPEKYFGLGQPRRIFRGPGERDAMTFLRPIWRIVLSCAALLAPTAAMAEPIADFYHGKTINLYVSFPPGGGYDIYARVLLPYFSRHIPGNPSIVVKNMEGGSGVRAAGYISTITPQDGTSLGLFLDTLTLGKVLGGPGEFDPVKLVWIGRIVSTATLAMVWHTSAVQSIEEAKQRQIIIAAS